MDFEYNEEQQLLADSVSKYLAKAYDFESRKQVINSSTGFNDAAWTAFSEMGLTAIPFAQADGGFGGGAKPAASNGEAAAPQGEVVAVSALETAELLREAKNVIIVPGYGMAVAQAQHTVFEITKYLREKGVNVRFGIHPVAGRMPGHMNVLLAEAEVPYDQVFEMEDINGEFGQVDVAIVLGANDVVNPAALEKGSPIYGMPILEAYKAKTVIVNKRSMASGGKPRAAISSAKPA